MGMTPEEWITRYADAWLSKDDESVGELFVEDGVFCSHPLRAPRVGRDDIRAFWREVTSSQENVKLRFGPPLVCDEKVIAEWWATMTIDGAQVTLPGCFLLRCAPDGRCEELREYWFREAGAHDQPEGWGA